MAAIVHRTTCVDVQLVTVELHAILPSVINRASMASVHRHKHVHVKLDGWEADVIKVRERTNIVWMFDC